MPQNGRFALSLRILAHLAVDPGSVHTSASIAAALKTHPVMVRRVFASLHKAGFIAQRKGPQGGARLKTAPKSIGFGDVYAAVADPWPDLGDKSANTLLARTRQDAITAMNDTSIASLVKRLKKV